MNDTEPDYDVALSYASEDRAYVEKVASCLKKNGINVFYDKFETTRLWGKNLYNHFFEVYGKAKYAVVFISKSYSTKAWTNHELKSAQARAFQENREYILPVRFDDTEIPGIAPTIAYVDAKTTTPTELSQRIIEKLHDLYPAESGKHGSANADSTIPSQSTVTGGLTRISARKRYFSIIAIVLLVSAAIFGIYRQYPTQKHQEISKPEGCRAKLQQFQDLLARDIDTVSLLAPGDQDKETIEKLNELQIELESELSQNCAENPSWVELTKLKKALTTIVRNKNIIEAGNQVVADKLSESNNKFVAYGALLFRAVALTYKGVCDKPGETLGLIQQAKDKQALTAAAYNLRGICRAEQARKDLKALKEHQPKKNATKIWKDSIDAIRDSLQDNETASKTAPSLQLAEIRFLNNKMWNSMQFLLGAMDLGPEKLSEFLQQVLKFQDMEAFFAGSLDMVMRCQRESQTKATFYESEADLHAFALTYYSDPRYKNSYQVQEAKGKLLSALEMALNAGLLTGEAENWEASKCYFVADVFLAPYVIDPKDPPVDCGLDPKITPQIDPQIQQRVDPQIRREIQVLVEDYFKRKTTMASETNGKR